MLRRPVAHRLFVLSEHRLARARRVDKHDVAAVLQPFAKRLRLGVRHDRVYDPHALEIARKHLRARRHDFITEQYAALCFCRKLRAFAARRGAKIKHDRRVRQIDPADRRLCGRFLHIKESRRVQRRCVRAKIRGHRRAVRVLLQRLQRQTEQVGKLRAVGFQRVDAERFFRRLVQRG